MAPGVTDRTKERRWVQHLADRGSPDREGVIKSAARITNEGLADTFQEALGLGFFRRHQADKGDVEVGVIAELCQLHRAEGSTERAEEQQCEGPAGCEPCERGNCAIAEAHRPAQSITL